MTCIAFSNGHSQHCNIFSFGWLQTSSLIIRNMLKPLQIILWALAMCLLTGCGGSRYSRNYYNAPIVENGTVRARSLLNFKQQRMYDKLFLESQYQKHKGNTDACRELLAAALEINPNASEALYELGKIETSFSMHSDSVTVASGDEMLLRAYQLEPSNPFFCRTLAQRWIRIGKFDRAAYLFENLVKNHPNSEDLGVLLGIYEHIPDFPAALHALERFESIEGADENTVLERFRILLKMGRTADAFGAVERLSEEHPEELRYRVLLGDLYMQNGYKEKALAIYGDVQTSDPDNALVRLAMLQYYIEERDTLRFETEMRAAMADPKIENSHKISLLRAYSQVLLRGNTAISPLQMLEYYRLALAIPQETSELGELCAAFVESSKLPSDSVHIALDAILRDQPEHMQARLQMLSLLVSQNRTDDIVKLCHDGRVYHPEELVYGYYQAIALLQKDVEDEALTILEESKQMLAPADSCEDYELEMGANIYQFLGDLYFERHDKELCFEAYAYSLQYNPENLVVLNNYAYYLAQEGQDLDSALSMSKKTIDAEPDNTTYLDTYAWVLYCKKQYTQARIYIEQMFRKMNEEELESPSSATLYDHAGDIYYKCGNRNKARDYWQKAAVLADDAELLKKIKAKLRRY